MKVIFPGTFDPITRGHEALIRRISSVFGEVIVGVARGVHKKTFFSHEERVDITQRVFAVDSNIQVHGFDGLLVNFMAEKNIKIVARGVRAVADFDFEYQFANISRLLNKNIETVFFMPEGNYVYLSSSIVREVASLGGDVSELVSPIVLTQLQKKI